jgi:glycosyltransferase involved in cell wall biosynthesis
MELDSDVYCIYHNKTKLEYIKESELYRCPESDCSFIITKESIEEPDIPEDKVVAVAMPVYNAREFLVESLDSIVKQTYKNIRFLIIDDCSTDNSLDILKEYESQYPNIKVYENNINLGVPKSLNVLLREIGDADYIARHDADDISLPKRISKQVTFLNKNEDIDLVGSYYIHIDQLQNEKEWFYKKPVTDEEIRKYHFSFSAFVHGSVMFRKSILDKVGYYDEDCSLWEPEDYDYWTRIMRECKVANIPEHLYKWRCYPDNRCGMAGTDVTTGLTMAHYKMWCREMGIEFNRKDIIV